MIKILSNSIAYSYIFDPFHASYPTRTYACTHMHARIHDTWLLHTSLTECLLKCRNRTFCFLWTTDLSLSRWSLAWSLFSYYCTRQMMKCSFLYIYISFFIVCTFVCTSVFRKKTIKRIVKIVQKNLIRLTQDPIRESNFEVSRFRSNWKRYVKLEKY